MGLDIVRAGAILAVLYNHLAAWWALEYLPTAIRAAAIGMAGVEVFFSLSGFLIGGILLRGMEDGLGVRALLRFWTRRWLRTLPAYWALLALLNWYFGTYTDWRSPIFLQSFVPEVQITRLISHCWSLVLEEWFYLFVPALLAIVAALLRRSRWAVPLTCSLLIGGSVAARLIIPGADMHNPLLRFDCAAWGLLMAWVARQWTVPKEIAAVALAIGSFLLVLVTWFWIRSFDAEFLAAVHFQSWGMTFQPLLPTMLEMPAALVALGMYRLVPRGRGILAWAISGLASISYSLYLAHVPVMYLSGLVGLARTDGGGGRVCLVLLIFAAALALRFGVELPVLALRDRFAPERRTVQHRALMEEPAGQSMTT